MLRYAWRLLLGPSGSCPRVIRYPVSLKYVSLWFKEKMQEQRVQALVLAAILAVGAMQSHQEGAPGPAVAALGALAGASLLVAAKSTEGGILARFMTVHVWAGHILLGVVCASGILKLPDYLTRMPSAMHLGFFVLNMIFQRDVHKVLPMWLVLLMAEVHTFAHTTVVSGGDRFLFHLLLAHLAGVVLPSMLLRHKHFGQHSSLPPGSIGTTAQTAHEADPQHAAKPPIPAALDSINPPTPSPPTPATTSKAVHAADHMGHVGPPCAVGHVGSCCAMDGDSFSRASSMVAASSMLLQQHQPYRSRLGKRRTVCMKIATHHHPDSLQPEAVEELACAVGRSGAYGSSRYGVVLDVSVRHGCILISLDVRSILPAGRSMFPAGRRSFFGGRHTQDSAVRTSEPSAAADGDEDDQDSTTTAARALACAQRLLPGLMQQLGLWHGDDSGSRGPSKKQGQPVLEQGQYLSLQLDDQLVQASLDPHSREWVFNTQAVEWAGSTNLPELHLAQPCFPAAVRDAGKRPDTHTAAFQVQLWCDAAVQPVVAGSCPGEGNLPAGKLGSGSAPGADATGGKSGVLRLWVHCQGQYLDTAVEAVGAVASGAGGGSCSGGAVPVTLQAVVQLPASSLARHHQPGGPAARVQLLTAELWAGDNLLSSTPLLLDAAQHLYPAVDTTFGWWGASAAAAAGLVNETAAVTAYLHAASAGEAAAEAAEAELDGHDAYVEDLAAWLQSMQQAGPVTCCDMCVAGPQRSTGLGLSHCQGLADDLQAHAAANQLTMTLALVQSQRARVLGPWQHRSAQHNSAAATSSREGDAGAPADASASHTASSSLPQQLWRGAAGVVACVRPCPACDGLYYDRLRVYLHRVWLYACLTRVLSNSIMTVQQWASRGVSLITCLITAWTLLHMAALLALRHKASMSSSSASPRLTTPRPTPATPSHFLARCRHWLVHESGFHVLAWCARLLVELGLALQVFALPEVACRPSTFYPYVAMDSMFAMLTEQMHSWGRVPAWVATYIAVVEALIHTNSLSSCPTVATVPVRVFFATTSLLVPVVMNRHWRKLLTLAPRSAAARTVSPLLQSSSQGKASEHAHAD